MNVIEQAHQAYSHNQAIIRTDRSVEAQLIGRITAKLRNANSDQAEDFPNLVSALYENRRFWTTMAAEVADKDNALPKELRAQIFYLAEFTEIHSQRVLQGKAKIDALIDVNTAVLRGLNGQGAA